MKTRWGRIALFFILVVAATYGLGRLLLEPLAASSRATSQDMVTRSVIANVAMLFPGLTAVVFVAFRREPVGAVLGLRWNPNRWWLVAWLLPALIALAWIALSLIGPTASLAPERAGPWGLLPVPQPWGGLLMGLVAAGTVCLPGALGEELAWRGFLYRELKHLGFWRSSLIIAAFWIAWHLPPYLMKGKMPGWLPVSLLMATPGSSLPVITRNVTFGKGWGVGVWPLVACLVVLALEVRSLRAPLADDRDPPPRTP